MCEKIPGGEVFISNQHEDVKEPGFYYIKFKQKMNIPILPIKEDKLYFKNGTFEGWY
jgi:hypothetical protein